MFRKWYELLGQKGSGNDPRSLVRETVLDAVEPCNPAYGPDALVELLRGRVVEELQDAMNAMVRNLVHATLG
jgi:hypothetical protein